MNLDDAVLTFGRAMRERHGVRVHKIPVDAGFTCPNRDGSKGVGGCTFCNNRSFSPATRRAPLREQLAHGRQAIRHARSCDRYLAYFQSYTNTYDDVRKLQRLYEEALDVDGMIGLSVGTRPDCVPEPVLELLAGLRDRGHEVWLELGLQSAFDATLERVNRGHGFAEYVDAVRRAQRHGLQTCTHLILGLPGEDEFHWRATLDLVLAHGTDGLKIHPLHVVRNTRLAHQWRDGSFRPLTRERYVEAVAQLAVSCPPEMVFHRLTGTAREPLLLAPGWCAEKWPVLNRIALRVAELRAAAAPAAAAETATATESAAGAVDAAGAIPAEACA